MGKREGMEPFLVKHTKWIVCGIMGTFVVVRHDLGVLLFLLGAVLNAILSKVLKRVFKQPRPDQATLSDPGFPSSHGMALAYFAASAILHIWTSVEDMFVCMLATAVLILLTCHTLYYRLTSQLHTIAQIVGGVALGAVFGCMWFFATSADYGRFRSPIEMWLRHAGYSDSSIVISVALLALSTAGYIVVASLERRKL